MSAGIEEPPYVPDYIAVCKGFSGAYNQLTREGQSSISNDDYNTLKRMFMLAIEWYISGAGRPDNSEWNSVSNLTLQISALSRLGNFDYALQYSDQLIEELKKLQDNQLDRNTHEAFCED